MSQDCSEELQPENDRTERLYDMLDQLDDLHTAISEGNTDAYAGLTPSEMTALLREVIYTAQQSIVEIENQRTVQMPHLRVVKKIS